MRILIAGETYYPALNGQSIFTTNLAEGLVQRGHEVLVVVPFIQARASQADHHGVRIEALKSVELSLLHAGVFITPFPGKAVRCIFEDFRPDVAHIQDHYPISHSVVKTARRSGVQVIGTNHFMPENLAPYLPRSARLKPALNWAMWRWVFSLYNRLDVATAPSRTAAAILTEQGLRVPVYPISCGVNLDRFHPDPSLDRKAWRQRYGLDPDRVAFIFVGRVDGEKRVDVLLRALQLLDRDDIQLVVVGDGAARSGLETLARELKLGPKVRFTGFVPDADLPSLLNSADIFAMPSEAELLSIATLEAMASGRPVLAARARALPELVSDGVNGYLFPPGNAREAAGCMVLMADQRDHWKQMGMASLEKVQSHGLEKTLQSYEMIYESLAVRSTVPHFEGDTQKRGSWIRQRAQ